MGGGWVTEADKLTGSATPAAAASPRPAAVVLTWNPNPATLVRTRAAPPQSAHPRGGRRRRAARGGGCRRGAASRRDAGTTRAGHRDGQQHCPPRRPCRLRRRQGVRRMPRQGARCVERLAPRPRDAGRRRQVRARQLRQREVHLRRHHVDVLHARRQVLRQHRRARRQARRLRDQVHVRRAPAAAVPDRASRAAACRRSSHRVGLAAEGGRAASAGSTSIPGRTSGPAIRCTGPASSQNWNFMCAECHSTNLRKNFDADDRRRSRRRGPRSTCRARPATAPASNHVAWAKKRRRLARRRGASKGLALALDERKGVDLDAGRRDRQRAAQRAARRRRARSRPARAATPARAASPTTTCTASRRSTRTGWRCSTTASTGTTGRCATRSTTGARSCRAGCTRRASPAPTATIRTR